ncbi:hypothetical protein KNE206_24000 [Kitasatospora sp. NE20-6]|uniref:hypothetical protein n=1 Tax=Kitasatospora sp. NE20-6 TaxID=2859066 RepID=UPI0034DBB931
MTDARNPDPTADRPRPAPPDPYWEGDFTLRGDEVPDRPAAPAIDPLGPSGITVRGRDLADLLGPAYRRFTTPD